MSDPNSATDLPSLTGLPLEIFASEVFRRYATKLIRIAEERLRPELRPKVSAEDVVQSAFKSFFRRLHEFRFDRDTSDALWALLVVITVRKCAKWDELFRAEKRGLHREAPVSITSSSMIQRWEMLDHEPGPEEAAMLAELIERLMSHFGPRQQQMILLRMEGYGLVEIADRLQGSRRTVARVIAEAKKVTQTLID